MSSVVECDKEDLLVLAFEVDDEVTYILLVVWLEFDHLKWDLLQLDVMSLWLD